MEGKGSESTETLINLGNADRDLADEFRHARVGMGESSDCIVS